MATLKEILLTPEKRPRLVRDTADLVESEVQSKGGMSGLAIKAGYKAVKAIKPTLVPDAIDGLLPEFIEQTESFYADWLAKGATPGFDQFLAGRPQEVASALLRVTDARARQTSHRTIKKTYEALRPHGEKNVVAAVPGLGRVLARHLG